MAINSLQSNEVRIDNPKECKTSWEWGKKTGKDVAWASYRDFCKDERGHYGCWIEVTSDNIKEVKKEWNLWYWDAPIECSSKWPFKVTKPKSKPNLSITETEARNINYILTNLVSDNIDDKYIKIINKINNKLSKFLDND